MCQVLLSRLHGRFADLRAPQCTSEIRKCLHVLMFYLFIFLLYCLLFLLLSLFGRRPLTCLYTSKLISGPGWNFASTLLHFPLSLLVKWAWRPPWTVLCKTKPDSVQHSEKELNRNIRGKRSMSLQATYNSKQSEACTGKSYKVL